MSDVAFIADLIRAAQQVCQSGETSLKLTTEQTLEFYKNRRYWGKNVKIHCEPGELVQLDLPSFPLPVQTNTQEYYNVEGVDIIPKFGFHSIVYFFLRRLGTSIGPLGSRH
ncbi:hypothetical protein PKNFJJPA_00183 [Salmonella phage vB_SenAc_BPS6]|uniref:Uncharacterized protein n=11 Tax=Kuttervirus TaxID=2169536 RepID=A0A7T8EMP5_9CAUD|nr:hypothetical protein SFP_0048 [Salmonella phage SFP10]YP_004957751.1 hypothetical protein CBA120_gp048 [Escherichia phage Cba120]YP_007002691.1 hypothetical protein F371_gp159 [Escherichia phage PhaxI]YP_009876595.1 hypothetical protein HYP09_gp081 [Salmonella phage BSP101]YP_009888853.1 hypothetical protein HYQ36_gp130 [Salmonella phage moki]YP_009948848.1 hypothetical protein HYQ25_gp047 [Salmonella phage Se-B]ARB06352.1 hypothetical protein S8_066 [Salmonella phage S8]AXC40760.1 hypoth